MECRRETCTQLRLNIELGVEKYVGTWDFQVGAISVEPLSIRLGSDRATINASRWLMPEAGFYDVIVHGSPNAVGIQTKTGWQLLNHRNLAAYIEKQVDYSGGAIRLASCKTGACENGFAQNLSNKLGVPVKAPTDNLFVLPGGRTVIGPGQFRDTGEWKLFLPNNTR